MVRGALPGALEQMVLLARGGLDGGATGREVYDVVTRLAGHTAIGVVLTVAVTASVVPAMRAVRVAPSVALQEE